MGASSWLLDNESKIYTIIKTKTYSTLKKKYPDIRFTTNDANTEPITVFPTVYIHELEGATIGNDLQADGVNGILTTFEVRVTVNTQKTDAKKVMAAIMDAFSELKFYVSTSPITSSDSNMFVSTARFRRAIGYNDTI